MNFDDQKSDENLMDERDVILVGRLGAQKRRSRARWGNALVIYMRFVAALWMFLGLYYWFRIIGPGQTPLETLPLNVAGGIVFLAVANVLAAAGLWMTAPWGGVIWLVTAATEMAFTLLAPAYFPGGAAVVSVYAALVLIYFLLTYYASTERID